MALFLALVTSGTVRIDVRGPWSLVIGPSPRTTDHSTLSARVAEAYGQLPLSFEANQGQTDGQVKFLSRGNGHTLFLTPTEAVIQLRNASLKPEIRILKSQIIRMKFIGANTNPRVIGLEELPGKVNHISGNDPTRWRTGVATYAKVKYENVYPGVDLVYYGNQGRLEYDFIVKPGADPRAIMLSFDGAASVEIDRQGDLVLPLDGREVRQRNPVAYQYLNGQRVEVESGFTISNPKSQIPNLKSEISNPKSEIRNPNSVVGFHLGAYDPTQPLIIDPVLVYSTYLGGGEDENRSGRGAIAVDAAGNAYVTGQTESSNFPMGSPLQPSLGGNCQLGPCRPDAFVAKIADGR